MWIFFFFCRGEMEDDSDFSENNNSLCEEIPRSREEMEKLTTRKCLIPSRNRAPKRPDKPLYMPRAARERLSLQNSQEPTTYKELSSSPSSSCISSSNDCHSCCDTTDTKDSSSTPRQDSQSIVSDRVLNHTAEISVNCPQEEKQKLLLGLREAEPLVWDQTVSSFTDMTLEDYETDKEYPATGLCSAQSEDMTTDTADISEEVSKHILNLVALF